MRSSFQTSRLSSSRGSFTLICPHFMYAKVHHRFQSSKLHRCPVYTGHDPQHIAISEVSLRNYLYQNKKPLREQKPNCTSWMAIPGLVLPCPVDCRQSCETQAGGAITGAILTGSDGSHPHSCTCTRRRHYFCTLISKWVALLYRATEQTIYRGHHFVVECGLANFVAVRVCV